MTTYTPAEAADRSGFTLDTLRYYEREGILAPVDRTSGGHRAYSDDDLDRLGFLRCLRDTGMPVAQLRRYGAMATDDSSLPERLELLEEHDAAVQRSIDELRHQQTRLRDKIGWYRSELGRPADDAADRAGVRGGIA